MSRRSRNGRGQPAPRISSNEKDISKPDLESVKDELFQLFRSGDIDLNDLVAALTENGTPITSEDLDQLSSDISSALKETAPSVPTSQATQPFEEPHVNTTQMQHQARQELVNGENPAVDRQSMERIAGAPDCGELLQRCLRQVNHHLPHRIERHHCVVEPAPEPLRQVGEAVQGQYARGLRLTRRLQLRPHLLEEHQRLGHRDTRRVEREQLLDVDLAHQIKQLHHLERESQNGARDAAHTDQSARTRVFLLRRRRLVGDMRHQVLR